VEAMKKDKILAYLDHNVLDLMTKGDPHNVRKLLREYNITPIYSDETLKEIQRSVGYESSFLNLLDEIEAKYIEPILDKNFKQTGQTNIYSVSPKVVYDSFLSNQKENPIGDFGLSEMLMKFYGGQENYSFKKILEKGVDDLQKYLFDSLEGINELVLDQSIDIENIKAVFKDIPELIKSQSKGMVRELDSKSESPVFAFEKATGIGPVLLNNISHPNVVEKIWELVSKKIDSPAVDIETFFGLKPHKFEKNSDRKQTLQEKVNAIYHQLNFLGYYRDSKMKKERRFRASFSDMTHASMASFCHLFLCRDEDLVMKAAAAYEYLGVQTKILHYKANKPMQPTANTSAD
jgi:hypothetical protein